MLNNLRLKPDALASLDLPVTVRAGLLGSLTLKVWLWHTLAGEGMALASVVCAGMAGPEQLGSAIVAC